MRFDWPRPPLVLGLVLGSLAEKNLFTSYQAYGAEMFLRPIVLVILVVNQHEVQNRVIHTQTVYTQSQLQEAANFLNAHYAGLTMEAVRERLFEAAHLLAQLGQLVVFRNRRQDHHAKQALALHETADVVEHGGAGLARLAARSTPSTTMALCLRWRSDLAAEAFLGMVRGWIGNGQNGRRLPARKQLCGSSGAGFGNYGVVSGVQSAIRKV